jgi:hypothetical protein
VTTALRAWPSAHGHRLIHRSLTHEGVKKLSRHGISQAITAHGRERTVENVGGCEGVWKKGYGMVFRRHDRVVLGSVAERVARNAKCPVTIVPHTKG